MDEPGAIIASLQTTDHFFVLVSRMGKTFDGRFSRTTANGLLEVNQFLSVGQTGAIMNRGFELFPKRLPVEHVSIEGWDVQLGEFGGFVASRACSCGFCRPGSVGVEQLLDHMGATEMKFFKACVLGNQGMVIR